MNSIVVLIIGILYILILHIFFQSKMLKYMFMFR